MVLAPLLNNEFIMDEDVVYMWHTAEYYSAIKKNEILPFAATWMDLEGIVQSKISQTEKDKYCMTSLVCGILKIQQTGGYNNKEADSQM